MRANPPRAQTSEDTTREIASVAGTVIFAAAAIVEFVRLQSNGAPWPGFTTETDWIFSLLTIVLWIGSAFVLGGRRINHIILAIAGAFAMFAFGIIGTVAGSRVGIVYVVFAMLMPVIMRLAFGSKIDLSKPGAEPERPHGPREVI